MATLAPVAPIRATGGFSVASEGAPLFLAQVAIREVLPHDRDSQPDSMVMSVADAGFVWTGLSVSKAGTVAPNGRVRTGHRKAAMISMGIATTGYRLMMPPFRGDP